MQLLIVEHVCRRPLLCKPSTTWPCNGELAGSNPEKDVCCPLSSFLFHQVPKFLHWKQICIFVNPYAVPYKGLNQKVWFIWSMSLGYGVLDRVQRSRYCWFVVSVSVPTAWQNSSIYWLDKRDIYPYVISTCRLGCCPLKAHGYGWSTISFLSYSAI